MNTTDASALLDVLRAAQLPVTGLSVGDLADPATWRFDGELTDEQRVQARDTLLRYLSSAPSSAEYWPAPPSAEQIEIESLKQQVAALIRGEQQ